MIPIGVFLVGVFSAVSSIVLGTNQAKLEKRVEKLEQQQAPADQPAQDGGATNEQN